MTLLTVVSLADISVENISVILIMSKLVGKLLFKFSITQ